MAQAKVVHRRRVAIRGCLVAICQAALVLASAAGDATAAEPDQRVVDLSLLVAPELPGAWPAPGFAPFHLNPYQQIGPLSAYNSDILAIDGNTGTQLDVPPHSIPLPETGLPNAGPFGRLTTDQIPAWQFCGEACVVDCRDLVDGRSPGRSELIKAARIRAWEQAHRPLSAGDVVLFHSGYTDKYYQPLPAGRRFAALPVEGRTPAWPDPDPDCMEYLASRRVMALATDSASMGPLPDLAEPTHIAGLKYGMIWTESGRGFDKLPVTGAFYCILAPKHADGAYSEGRALAVVDQELAPWLIERARKKQVVDLSVTLSTELPITWPGRGPGDHRQPYLRVPLFLAANLRRYHETHLLDAHAGTHLVPPSYALPSAGFDNNRYAPEVRGWLAEYEKKYPARGTSDVTVEQAPLEQTCGWARVIDVRHLVGSTQQKDWPRSPEITVADIKKFESQSGPLEAGQIVLFASGYNDKHCRPGPDGAAAMADPLAGKREGWPAPGPDAIAYLAERGIRAVGSDGPTIGGSEPKRALWTYWLLGSKGMVAVEYLVGLDKLPPKAYFLFAPVKVRGAHGGPGRALAVY
jgi:kynurenine formamidase